MLATCDDESVIGAPFYVMEKIEGDVVVTDIPPALDTPAERARMAEELIDALVEIHAVDWQASGLEGYGKPSGYLERQVRRFSGLWEHNKTREVPEIDEGTAWLAANMPESGPATIVHGDYRLGNTMMGPGAPARLVAIFDWELATIGDPLADVGYLTATYAEPGEAEGEHADVGPELGDDPRGLPEPGRADRPLRGALGPLDERRATGTRRWPCGSRRCSWRARTSACSRERPTTRSSSCSTRACPRWRATPWRSRMATDGAGPRRGLLVDFGGVLTTDVFTSFQQFCETEGLEPGAVRDRFRGDPAAQKLLFDLEEGKLTEEEFEPLFAELLQVADPANLIDRLFAGMRPDEAMLDAVARGAKRAASAPA